MLVQFHSLECCLLTFKIKLYISVALFSAFCLVFLISHNDAIQPELFAACKLGFMVQLLFSAALKHFKLNTPHLYKVFRKFGTGLLVWRLGPQGL